MTEYSHPTYVQQYVYFFKPCGLDGPIKIGCSVTPHDRMATFVAWSPFPLELIGSVRGTGKDEVYLHRCFWSSRSHGEWFRSTPELRQCIARILELGHVPRDVVPVEQMGKPERRIRTQEHCRRMSYRMRVDWQTRRLRTPEGYYTEPRDIRDILDRWSGNRGHERRSPSPDEFARLDAFLANPTPELTFHAYAKRVAA
jgi:hypothetical protein